ncbi:hypothetical protein JXA48_05150 [Candidatus Woesearchaeota archaeon]|nr:hypothetical protein [Candidatus Woesearchaeota archaeon]
MSDLPVINSKISQSIIDREFLIIENVPFCLCPIEHCSYLYFGTGKGQKPYGCSSCKLKYWCDYDKSQDLEIVSLTDCDPDLLKFLEERDENINDWF